MPSSVRSDTSAASPLSTSVAPLLRPQLESLFSFVRTNWPQITLKHDEFLPESEKIRTSLFGDDSTQWDARSIFKPRLLIKGRVILVRDLLKIMLFKGFNILLLKKMVQKFSTNQILRFFSMENMKISHRPVFKKITFLISSAENFSEFQKH